MELAKFRQVQATTTRPAQQARFQRLDQRHRLSRTPRGGGASRKTGARTDAGTRSYAADAGPSTDAVPRPSLGLLPGAFMLVHRPFRQVQAIVLLVSACDLPFNTQ